MLIHSLYVFPFKSPVKVEFTLKNAWLQGNYYPSIEKIQSKELFEYMTRPLKFSSCPLCNYSIDDWEGDSTNRDVILSFCLTHYDSIISLIRSIRTAKCKARVVIIADCYAYIGLRDDGVLDLAKSCGIFIVNLENYNGNNITRSERYHMKLYLYKSFISQYISLIDRVFTCDLMDSLFQSDPFKSFMHSDSVYCYTENITIKKEEETYYVSESLQGQYYLHPETLVVTPVSFMGSPIETIKLIDLIQSFWNIPGFNDISDQPPTTIIYRNHLFADHDIDFRTFDWCHGATSLNVNEVTNHSIGFVSIEGCKKRPFYLHHTNYDFDLIKSFYLQCPPKRVIDTPSMYILGLTVHEERQLLEEHLARRKKSLNL